MYKHEIISRLTVSLWAIIFLQFYQYSHLTKCESARISIHTVLFEMH